MYTTKSMKISTWDEELDGNFGPDGIRRDGTGCDHPGFIRDRIKSFIYISHEKEMTSIERVGVRFYFDSFSGTVWDAKDSNQTELNVFNAVCLLPRETALNSSNCRYTRSFAVAQQHRPVAFSTIGGSKTADGGHLPGRLHQTRGVASSGRENLSGGR